MEEFRPVRRRSVRSAMSSRASDPAEAPRQSRSRRIAVRVAGISLAVVAGGFFAVYAYRALAAHDLSALFTPRVSVALSVLTLLYVTSLVPTAMAWAVLLRGMGHSAGLLSLLAVLATTQFAKYLPGNVAHYVGRVGLGRAHGVPLAAGVVSVAYELLLATLASAHLGAVTLLWAPPPGLRGWAVFEHRVWLISGVTATAILALWALVPVLAGWLTRRNVAVDGSAVSHRIRPRAALLGYVMYGIGFSMIGVGLWFLAGSLQGYERLPGPLFFIGAFATSWIAGLVSPGAPAGLGVREAVLSAWLSTVVMPAHAVVLVLALRIATTAGDLSNFIIGGVLLTRLRRASGPYDTPSTRAAREGTRP